MIVPAEVYVISNKNYKDLAFFRSMFYLSSSKTRLPLAWTYFQFDIRVNFLDSIQTHLQPVVHLQYRESDRIAVVGTRQVSYEIAHLICVIEDAGLSAGFGEWPSQGRGQVTPPSTKAENLYTQHSPATCKTDQRPWRVRRSIKSVDEDYDCSRAFKYSRYRLSVDIDKSLSIIMDGGVFVCIFI